MNRGSLKVDILRTLVALVIIAGAGFASYEKVSFIHSAIDNLKTQPISTNEFPYKLDVTSFTSVSQDQAVQEIQNTNVADLVNHTIKVFLPLGKQTLEGVTTLSYGTGSDSILPDHIDQTEKSELEAVQNFLQLDGLADGTIVQTPLSGKLRVADIAGQRDGTGTNSYIPSYSLVRIDFQDKDGDLVSINISILGGIPLIDLSQASWDGEGIDIKAGQDIFKISEATAMGGTTLAEQRGQIVIQGLYVQQDPFLPVPLSIEFFSQIIGKN